MSWLVALVLLFTMTAQGQERQALNGGNSTNSVPEPAGGVPNYGYAIQFNGGGYLSSLTSNTDLNAVAAFTIDFTVATTNANAASGILLSQTSDGTDSGWAFFLIEDYFSFMYHDLSGNPQEMDSDEFPGLTNGLPHYIRIVQNMNNATYTQAIYVDGTRIATATTNAGFRVDSAPFMVGSGIFGGDFYPIFATIDEVRVTTNALIEPDASSYTPDSCPSAVAGTIHLWHFNEGTGTTTTDSVGSATLTMESSPAPTWVTGFCSPSPAQIGVSPTSYAFTAIATGTTEVTTFTVTNYGGIAVSNGTATSTAPFSISSGTPFSVPGHGSTNVTVQFAPTSAGSFATNVIFTTANAGNSTNQVTGTGIVAIVSMASFTGSPTNGGVPLPVTFTDGSSGTIANWFWNFGDGATTNFAVSTNPVHTYAAGTYTVSLTVSGPLGTSNLTRTNYIVALSPPHLVVNPASRDWHIVTVGQTSNQTFSVMNTGQQTLTGSVLSVTSPFVIVSGSPYNVAAGGTGTVTVSFNSVAGGVFTGTVIFASNGGSSINTVTVLLNAPPVVTAGSSQTVAFPSCASLNGRVTDDGLPYGILTSSWSEVSGPGTVTFGNVNVADTTACFSTNGTYVLCLTASDGAVSRSNTVIVATKVPPQITASPAATNKLAQMDGRTVVAGYGPVCFTVGMYDPNGDPLSCLWDFGDGDTSSDCDPCHVFTNCGPYVVSVTVSDGLASTNATSLVTVTCELTITKMQIKLNFAKTNSDSCSLTAALDLGSDYNLTNKVVTLDIGGTTNTTFTLDAKGKGKGVGHFGSCKLAYNKKMKQWTLRAKLAKGSWQASWATYGLENKNVLKPGIWVKMPVVVLTGDDALADERLVNYTAIKNKSGSAK